MQGITIIFDEESKMLQFFATGVDLDTIEGLQFVVGSLGLFHARKQRSLTKLQVLAEMEEEAKAKELAAEEEAAVEEEEEE